MASSSSTLQLRSKPVMTISPNLDALVEHEERIQSSKLKEHGSGLSRQSPQNLIESTGQRIGGLPPPPRRGRRLRSKGNDGEDKDTTSTILNIGWTESAWSSSSTNPWINPAPALTDVGKEVTDYSNRLIDGREECQVGTPSYPIDTSNIQRPHATSSLVGKRLDGCKTATRVTFRKSSLLLPCPSLHIVAAGRSNHNRNTSNMFQDRTIDIRRCSDDFIDICSEETAWDSRHMDDSNSSVSTVGPATSRKGRSSRSPSTATRQTPDFDRRSFLDLCSPASPKFTLPTIDTEMLIYRNDDENRTPKATSPKSIFSLSSLKPSSRDSSPHCRSTSVREELPLITTNFLDLSDRSDLVKKSRKLARLFGETPAGEVLSLRDPSRLSNNPTSSQRPRPLDSERLQYISSGRRHSIEYSSKIRHKSFIDLSDEEDFDDAVSAIDFAPNPSPIATGSLQLASPSVLSLYDAMTPEQQAEEERRRNREKLSKLHRFLGSRVPADLVLGVAHADTSLPPVQPEFMSEETDNNRKVWLRKRRSSSAGALPSWSDDVDRMKEDLNEKEKAINVRRAQKMEKMFGVAPPQTLYHTRHSPSPSIPAVTQTKRSKSPPKPSFGGFIPPGEIPSPTYQQRNPNRSSYMKQKYRRKERPSTSESSRRLLSDGQDCYSFDKQAEPRTSVIYHHYHHSLKSLNDILDRDDKESLAELHQYLNDYEETNATTPLLRESPLANERRLSNASSIKSERRRSLPARTSMLSIASEISIGSPKPENDFQIRRRRAAKLAQFFGVNYRELINDVLESLEHGLEHERKRGTLRAEEVEDLLDRLRKIKVQRRGFF